MIRSVIEYACPVWQSGLTGEQLSKLENLQRRAIKIIFGSRDYDFYYTVYSIELIKERLDSQARKFFFKMCSLHDCLHSLLPAERETLQSHKNYEDQLNILHCPVELNATLTLSFRMR